MPKARKLPSGSWRCRPFVGYDRDHKPHYESVTVKDPSRAGKRKCEDLAREIQDNAARIREGDLTVREALDRYIEMSAAKRSPSTISGYRSVAKNSFDGIKDVPLRQLSDALLSQWMAVYSQSHSAKTCRNAFSLLTASLRNIDPHLSFFVRLPEPEQFEYQTPEKEDVALLLKEADPELRKAILLAAYGTFREGEICALRYDDISDDSITLTNDLVWDSASGSYKLHTCKNPQSRRTVYFPKKIIAEIKKDPTTDRIVNLSPKLLSLRFARLRNKLGLPPFRFHDLRAYGASVRHALGVPDQYIMADGGWKTDHVLKRVYRRAMDDRRKEYTKVIAKDFDGII